MSDLLRVTLAPREGASGDSAGGENFHARYDENLLTAAQRAHWLIRFGCRNGNCEACAATLQKGCVEQRGVCIDAATGPEPILLCLAHAQSDVLINLPGEPLHGSVTHARRSYAQLQNIERDGECWRATFTLPAGKPLPVYAGQFANIETDPPFDAWIEANGLNGRELTLVATQPLNLAPGARVHLRYPLGYAYRIAVSDQPVWILCDAAMRLRARRLSAAVANSILIDVSNPAVWPATPGAIIYAYSCDATILRQWYRQLLEARVAFIELRSDLIILRRWQVWRQDDNANRYVMADYLDEKTARAQVEEFTARGHKQLYWAEPVCAAIHDSK